MNNLRFFKIEEGDKYFISHLDGGYSYCIRPQDYPDGKSWFPGSVLANCVGCACGCFNENISYLNGTKGMAYPLFNCNAEDFIERAKKNYPELIITKEPVNGGMMVWEGKGDLAGHVAYVNNYDGITVNTAESSYGGAIFYNKDRNNDNGRWGMSGSYEYLGCINPNTLIVPNVEPDPTHDQVEVTIEKLRVREAPNLEGKFYCYASIGYYNVYGISKADDYIWYKISDKEERYIANVDTNYYPKTDTDIIKQLEIFIKQLTTTIQTLTKENAELLKDNATLSKDNKEYKEAMDNIYNISKRFKE